MNRYPVWKYLMIAIVLVLGVLYTLPNFYGEAPAVQVSSGKSTLKLSPDLADRLSSQLEAQGVKPDGVFFEETLGGGTLKLRFNSSEEQLKARDFLQSQLNPDPADPDYIVALNLLSRSPDWLTNINALPMYLGLDLRGGVHFLLQVDMDAALEKRKDALLASAKQTLREEDLRYASAPRTPAGFNLTFRDAEARNKAQAALAKEYPDLQLATPENSTEFALVATLAPEIEQQAREYALRQNITTLHNRINELGVAEPVIQRQGADRIVVQLPGVQDTAKAKDILGRTATLEVRMVDDSPEAQSALASGIVPFGLERYTERGGRDLLLKSEVILTGDNLTDAQAGFDNQTQEPAVHLTLDSQGSRIFRNVTAESIGKRMAIVLIEKGKGEVVTAPVIRGEIGGGRVQISGSMNTVESADLALLLRAGSLAAPMDIIEERTIGPSLGADNIDKGINSTLYGFVVLGAFMIVYYLLFGVFSVFALAVNVMLLFALLSVLQATLTLPGIAAIALTLGMAIDANVLINERIREELRDGAQPQQAIAAGYERAWATILDSNITTLIAGLALLIFGSGPVRGFAVVHCLGILTSIFSAVVVSRGVVNLWYGRKKKLDSVSIGQIWRPSDDTAVAKKA
ncbi:MULTISPECIES: protein translocase subunit SecD [Limnobacter]|jgi:preprotein translocase subunit SecD|uniref:Protein translocase subunit SecD n=1 Tax=Limnobacter profundi TaxID=2732163 RepID=A0ABX6N337_9BURK|nr:MULTISPECIES: protein translocase subunit SecD [unclassified Limnobacter]MBA4314019.1 protein translocase subunit SecD [Alcaligenaceae bacterium]PZO17496.1 MAG: protein translocase subunit SecD [Betaproteobacteria bacterium]MDP3271782.1 protein translocase subunit SecD [Limnobacter sp.]PZO25619.1 MAG: protein translocase subunit SecD [Betaproteobacteria bacterium]QJR28653.1 protein translocase subunit SecD [Limnobacter sp. SAORIC-580]